MGRITYEPEERPELANLLRIYGALEGISFRKVPQLFEDDNMFQFKEKLSNKLIDKICPIGYKARNLCINDEDMLLEIIDYGAKNDSNSVSLKNTHRTNESNQKRCLY